MPRTRKAAARKKKNEEDAAQKANEAAEATPKELITFVIKNLQAQSESLTPILSLIFSS